MKRLILGTLCVAVASASSADVLGLKAGASVWNADFSGEVQSGPEPVDLASDLGFSDENYAQAYVSLELPIPLLPSARLQYTALDQEAAGQLNTTFEGVDYNGATTTSLDLTHVDLVVYWELLDNVVSLDLGVQGKIMDGELVLSGQSEGQEVVTTVAIDETLPLLYGAIGADLPLTGLGVYLSVAGITYEDNQVTDINAKVFYDMKLIGFEGGWRELRMQLDDLSDVNADVAVGGPYLGVNLHF
jgi:outer membrane protein